MKDESSETGRKVSRKRLAAMRVLFNGLYALSGLLFVISYVYQTNPNFFSPGPYLGWAILCLFLGFFINVVHATR